MNKNIAVLPGDGIGPEITREGIKVLDRIAELYGHTFHYDYCDFGASAYFKTGSSLPPETIKLCDNSDAIIKGPAGLAVEEMNKIPMEHSPEKEGILGLRKRYDTFANYRPVFLPSSLINLSPLKKEVIPKGLDILMIRELVGGIYFGEKTESHETNHSHSSDNATYTRQQVERVARIAFEEARKKKGPMTNVHKANVLATSRFWNRVVEEIAKEYPDVEYRSALVDNVAYQLVINPAQYNGVMLLENMQGDILSDQAGGIIGSLGFMPSACIGPEKSYVEAAHGSAPDIGGKNIANPYSMIGSMALLCEKVFGLEQEARSIWEALIRTLEQGFHTQDLVSKINMPEKTLKTDSFGDKVIENLVKTE
ncbi:MAG: 3-isopropylmalate dehydrogenase [Spirochaetales bacterium]|nr:3-isopropylmalate dehydrogenase [Spirochaetales bacterium]